MLTEPKPPATEPYATGIWHYARGAGASSRAARPARAEAELAALTALLDHEAFKTTLKDLPLLTNLQIASRIVRGELAARARPVRRGDPDRLAKPSRSRMRIPYNEPPVWHQPTRQVLGALLLEAGRAQEAEAVYREDLARVPRERLVAVRSVAEPRGAGPHATRRGTSGRASRRRGRAPTSR